jgi:hypothetical protein
MFSVLVRIVNFTEVSTAGYRIEPPNPPNAGMQNEPPLVLSLAEPFPYFLVVRWPVHVGAPLTARVILSGTSVLPLASP